ncbi:trypsin-like peptidase domain-containing protein [Kitasatospora sp. NPDC088779]|uniref:nSTAND1 domain-containing NTPase n=1 Tax=Kitasatospora sp. NPDC088779 TaxID=3154964 RepID=UPI00342A3476
MTPATSPAPAGGGPRALDTALLRIHDGHGNPIGAGFLVADDLAVTCAHVVSAALGMPRDVAPAAGATVRVDLPLSGGSTTIEATVENWFPPQGSGAGDVAVLRLGAALPGAAPVRLIDAQEVWGHPARAFGFPVGRPGGVWHRGELRGRQADGWVQTDLVGEGYRVSGGFSGSPVWDDDLVGVVGMIAVAESGDPPVSYLIPTDGLVAAWPQLRDLALPPSPFRGLLAFQEADAAIFHGREAESEKVAALVARKRWTTVVGPSGSGKSSLALAGVVPRRRVAGDLAVVVRPGSGSSPLAALAAALLRLLEPELSGTERLNKLNTLTGDLTRPGTLADLAAELLEVHGSTRLLVVVDQLEELLTTAAAGGDAFADVLFSDTLPPAVHVLTTLRADFLESALTHPSLGHLLNRNLYALGAMGPEQLREVIAAPVDAVPGVRYQAGLVERILRDTNAEPGALPLLGLSLDLLWRRQSGGELSLLAYEELGGVAGALGDHADQVWEEHVGPEDEPVARRLFTRLIRLPAGTAAAIRRTALRTELDEGEWRLAQRLIGTRLLVAGSSAEGTETVELAHDALIGNWNRLATWVSTDRKFLAWRETLRHDLERWQSAECSPELLPTTIALASAREWLDERGTDLSKAERDYLEQGRAHHRSRRRWRRILTSGLVLVITASLVFGGLFLNTRQQSRERSALANSRALAQASQDEEGFDSVKSVMLALAAYQTSPTREARNQLLRQYMTYSLAARVLSGLPGKVKLLQTSADGNVVLARSGLGRAVLWTHAATGQVRSEAVPVDDYVLHPLVSADGKRAGFEAEDGTVVWFDVDANADEPIGPIHRMPRAPEFAKDNAHGMGAAISADGKIAAVQVEDVLVWWNLADGSFAGRATVPHGVLGNLWIGPDDRTVLVGTLTAGANGNRLVSIDMATSSARPVLTDADRYVLSGNRTAVVVCRQVGEDQRVLTLQRISDGAEQGRPFHQNGSCGMMATDTTGHLLAFSGGSGRVFVVDLDRGAIVSEGRGLPDTSSHQEDLVSADGRLFLVGNDDSSTISYTELPTGPGTESVSVTTLTNDGSHVVTVLDDGSALLLTSNSAKDDRVLARAPRAKPYWVDPQERIQFSKDGQLLADREGVNLISVREVSTLREKTLITTPMPPPARSKPGAVQYYFDRGGHLVTLSGTLVQQWDATTGHQIAQFDTAVFHPRNNDDGVPDIGIGPYPADNQVAVLLRGDPVIRVVNVTTGRTTTTIQAPEDTIAFQFDASGRYFALLRHGSVVELWRRDPLRKEIGPLRSLAEDSATRWWAGFVDGDGRYLIAANGTVRIYQVGKDAYVDSYDFGRPRHRFADSSYSFADVSANGTTVLYVESGSGGPLTLDPTLWQRELCDIVGHRTFTPEERAGLPVPLPARPIC